MRTAFALLLALIFCASATARDTAALDALVRPMVGRDTPGLAVLVMRNGDVLAAQGYGLADLKRRTKVTAATKFDLASVSKQMTALLAMKMARDGRLKLDVPVALLRQPQGMRAVTANDLIHHCAGLADYLDVYWPEQTNADVVAYANQTERFFAPGARFMYSNTGYVVLAATLARAAGARNFPELLTREIFAPLGMTEAAILRPAHGAATGYAGSEGRFTPSDDPSVTTGDGNVFASIDDLALYEAAFFSDAILPRAEIARLFQPGRLDNGNPTGSNEDETYGFGWFLYDLNGPRFAYHGGSWSGTAAYFQRNLDTGLSVVVLANSEDFDAAATADAIAALYDGD